MTGTWTIFATDRFATKSVRWTGTLLSGNVPRKGDQVCRKGVVWGVERVRWQNTEEGLDSTFVEVTVSFVGLEGEAP